MNQVRKGIFDLLEASSELDALATSGVWWRSAPQEVNPPLVIVSKSSGVRHYTFDDPPLHDESWLVKGVGTAEQAEDIDEKCQEILDNAAIVVDGHTVNLKPMPQEDTSYQELEYGELYDHVGTFYRIVTERAS